MECWNRTQQIEDIRAFRLIQAQYRVASALGGRAVQIKPGDLFPSLRHLGTTEDGDINEDDVDPEQSHRQVMAALSRFTL